MGFYIYYNLLNLPTVIYTEGDMGLYYTYLSDGTKIKVCGYDDNEPTRYAGSLVYNDGTFESASFGGGRIVGTNNGTNSEVHYFLTDHLGSTRVVAKVTPAGRIDLDRKDYYPFGKEWKQSGMPTSSNTFLFSGKERQHSEGYDGAITSFYDFGARFYDSDGVHFLQQDPLLEKYYSIGSYNYCAGNPIDRIDFNGNLIIFINGFTFKKSEQGTANYWKKTDKNGDVDFATSVQAQLNDDNAMFRHGGTSTSANARIHDGEAQAAQDYQEIINTILGTDGIPKETIKIITHSMGAAFGKGYVRKLKELLVKNGHPEVLISLIADFDPYQAAKLSADSNIYTLQFTHQGIIADQRQNNLPDTNYRVDSQRDSHSIYSFFNDISRLQEGTYVYDGNNWILQN